MTQPVKASLTALGVVLLLALASGCSTTRRYVTHTVSGVGGPSSLAHSQPALHVGAEGDDLSGDDFTSTEGDPEAAGEGSAASAAPPIPPPVVQPPARATRWMYIAYAEVKETNLFIMRSYKTTSKILRCLINDDNSIDCQDQEGVSRLFNPQNK